MNNQITLIQALDRIAEELCRRELQYRIASIQDCGTAPDSEDWFTYDVNDGDMGEMIMEHFKSKLYEFTTRVQAMDYLIERKGMTSLLAFAAIDQQYNYDEPDEHGVLRNGPKDSDNPDPVTQNCADLDMVYDTWLSLLSLDDKGNVLVDGEPTYDRTGHML